MGIVSRLDGVGVDGALLDDISARPGLGDEDAGAVVIEDVNRRGGLRAPDDGADRVGQFEPKRLDVGFVYAIVVDRDHDGGPILIGREVERDRRRVEVLEVRGRPADEGVGPDRAEPRQQNVDAGRFGRVAGAHDLDHDTRRGAVFVELEARLGEIHDVDGRIVADQRLGGQDLRRAAIVVAHLHRDHVRA